MVITWESQEATGRMGNESSKAVERTADAPNNSVEGNLPSEAITPEEVMDISPEEYEKLRANYRKIALNAREFKTRQPPRKGYYTRGQLAVMDRLFIDTWKEGRQDDLRLNCLIFEIEDFC